MDAALTWYCVCVRVVRRLQGALVVALVLGPACDEAGDPADEAEHSDVPEVVEGCPQGDGLVEIGQTRVCMCDDGTSAEQTCLSTGEYADCKCVAGGW